MRDNILSGLFIAGLAVLGALVVVLLDHRLNKQQETFNSTFGQNEPEPARLSDSTIFEEREIKYRGATITVSKYRILIAIDSSDFVLGLGRKETTIIFDSTATDFTTLFEKAAKYDSIVKAAKLLLW